MRDLLVLRYLLPQPYRHQFEVLIVASFGYLYCTNRFIEAGWTSQQFLLAAQEILESGTAEIIRVHNLYDLLTGSVTHMENSLHGEPHIVISGEQLTPDESMTVRVAIEEFARYLSYDENCLGDDMRKLYLDSACSIRTKYMKTRR